MRIYVCGFLSPIVTLNLDRVDVDSAEDQNSVYFLLGKLGNLWTEVDELNMSTQHPTQVIFLTFSLHIKIFLTKGKSGPKSSLFARRPQPFHILVNYKARLIFNIGQSDA